MTVAPLFRRVLLGGLLLAVVIAVVGCAVAGPALGWRGTGSVLLGAALSFAFSGATAASVLLAGRLAKGDLLHPAFFGTIGGVWLLKILVFLVVVIVLGRQQWISGLALVVTMMVSVLGGLVLDAVVISRSRLGRAIDVPLPDDGPRPS
jgi:hypothetical protein